MKSNINNILILILTLPTLLCAQSGWVKQKSGTTARLNAVSINSSTNVVVIGAHGTMLYSSKAGQGGYFTIPSGTMQDLHGICFIDPYEGIAVGDSGVILQSTTSGTSWKYTTCGLTNPVNFYNVVYINSSLIFITGGISINDTVHSLILRSTDFGVTWKVQYKGSADAKPLYSISFSNSDPSYGVAVGKGKVLTTIDQGDTWTEQNAGTSSVLLGANFIDRWTDSVVIAVDEGGKILKTTDRGVSLAVKSTIPTHLYNVSFAKDTSHRSMPKVGFVVGDSGAILRSNDAGEKWTALQSGVSTALFGVHVTDVGIMAVGDSGTILRASGESSSVDDGVFAPDDFFLEQNVPNPASYSTVIRFSPHRNTHFQIRDFLGRVVYQTGGSELLQEVGLDVSHMPNGMYCYSVENNQKIYSRLMTVIH